MAAYVDNQTKFTAVLNRAGEIGQLLNALGHITAGLAADLGPVETDILSYENPASGITARLSRWPFIVLEARNSAQLAKLALAAREAGLAHNVFVTAMLGSDAESQIRQTRQASAEELEYLAVVLFGEAEVLRALTKKFSIFSRTR